VVFRIAVKNFGDFRAASAKIRLGGYRIGSNGNVHCVALRCATLRCAAALYVNYYERGLQFACMDDETRGSATVDGARYAPI